MACPAPARRDCSAVFHYVDSKFSREYLNDRDANQNVGQPMKGWGHVSKPITCKVHDVRGREKEFSLDENGFTYCVKPLKYDGPINDYEQVKARYWPEVEELIREVCPTATEVCVYNTVPRTSHGRDPEYKGEYAFEENKHHDQVYKAHVDQDIAGALQMVRDVFGSDADEADRRIRRRFQIVNVWRPMHTVHKDPLAVVDLASLRLHDLAAVGTYYPEGRSGSLLAPRAAREGEVLRQRWHYMYRQRPDEVLVFTQFDNAPAARCWGHVVHSSFVDDEEEALATGRVARVSIEARALVFYGDQEGVVPGEELIRWQAPEVNKCCGRPKE